LQPDGLVVSPAFRHVAVVPAGATTIYVGGQNGVDADGKIVSDDVAEQSARAIDNASTALEAAGASLADVVQWTVFMAEDADLNAAYEAISPRLAGPGAPPAGDYGAGRSTRRARRARRGERDCRGGARMTTPLTGTTSNGVPYLAVPPASDAATAPVIILWHLMDAPRSEAAFAAALPLDGLDAWKVYLGLPTFGARSLPGGVDEVMKLLATDAPGLVHGPVHSQAAEEFPAAWADLSRTLGIGADVPAGLVGGSMGAAIASEVLARGTSGATAAVLVSPLLQLRPMIDAVSPQFGGYDWTDAGTAAAERLDYEARASELVGSGAAIRIIVGADDEQAIVSSALMVAVAVGADVQLLDGMEHALAEEPGIEPTPQTEVAKRVDPIAAEWLREYLT
jgi:enamine deaminase RidA (YjgF/YER057c/UK114 family)